jgi:hypothetical protein
MQEKWGPSWLWFSKLMPSGEQRHFQTATVLRLEKKPLGWVEREEQEGIRERTAVLG